MDSTLENYAEQIAKIDKDLTTQREEVQELIKHIQTTSIKDILEKLEQIDNDMYFIIRSVGETKDKYEELVSYAQSIEYKNED